MDFIIPKCFKTIRKEVETILKNIMFVNMGFVFEHFGRSVYRLLKFWNLKTLKFEDLKFENLKLEMTFRDGFL